MPTEQMSGPPGAGRSGKTRVLLPLSGLWMARNADTALDSSAFDVRVATLNSPDMHWCDVVLPLSVQNQLTLVALYPEDAGRKFLSPSAEATRLCADKAAFAGFMRHHGFAGNIPGDAGSAADRVIMKPRIGEGGAGVTLVNRSDHGAGSSEGFLAQEWIDAEVEYTANIIFNGKIRFSLGVEYKKHERTHIKRKPNDTAMAFRPVPDAYLELFGRILTKLEFQGICCIDYLSVDGRPVILEINPRICGSIFSHEMNRLIEAYCAAIRPAD